MSDAWKVGKEDKKGILREQEYCILIGVITKDEDEAQVMEYLDELDFLANTAGAITKKVFTQKIPHPNVKTFVGTGKLEEIREYIERNEDITLAIFDEDLTGKQNSFLEEYLKVKIVDRSTLILDIFAERAQTAQAKTQVELAQMQYLLPRLRGLWTHLERQRGGIGMRGPGEMEIETDRRIIRDKIALLKKRLEKIDQQAQTQRKNRGELIRVSLVGYTNVGKSTLMNVLSKSDVFAENKLFATLDTTVRKVVWDTMPFLLSDTVGFIRKLPHHLVESFKSTLDEVRESDILVHVVDIAHPQHEDHILTVQNTLNDLGASDRTTLMVFNKVDLYREKYFDDYLDQGTKKEIMHEIREKFTNLYNFPNVLISATDKENIDQLRDTLREMIMQEYKVRYPFQVKSW
ncbi:MAG TPA: GTPase HflX [Saprospiraceae bacterium]|mgnify:FL=1|jgi:GTP-binding protein HflX|nr:GTPase HflX [Saprospiraceae bacterium]HMT53859.1 GTPase HflX [Saprospiraceae bacterium]HMT70926.1 GTPase HflX [Saprospiraceae bacterium]HQV96747.1 GTPase HflX [Saprospiraceae bacterium]